MPYLDGKEVEPSVIDPAKHMFIGTFRPPQAPVTGPHSPCPCTSQYLLNSYDIFLHWQKGHFDEPQYVSI